MQLSPLPALPGVSYVMPVLNEANYLERAVRTILAQDYAGSKEIVLALGPSTDGTNDIAANLAREDHRVRLVDNPEMDIPIGLNLAIAASSYPVIVRVDAHSELTPDYTRIGIKVLRAESAANVGGIMRASGSTPVQRAIASAYNSPVGLGGGAYHGDGKAGEAESAYLGIFRREAIDFVQGYDPFIRRGEDWELNLRIRLAGGRIWFEPSLGVTYWPRASFNALARQFYATGAWRAILVKKYPKLHPWRFFAPGILVLTLAFAFVLGLLQLVGFITPGWWSAIVWIPALYLTAVIAASFTLPGISGLKERFLGVCAVVTMHVSWGSGFLKGLVFGARQVIDTSRAR